MKYAWVALLALLCSACTTFENPVAARSGPRLDEKLVGYWFAEKEQARIEIEVSRDGAEGHVVVTDIESDQEPKIDQYRLITARLDRWSLASVSGGKGLSHKWVLLRYELTDDGALNVYTKKEQYWLDAVENRQVCGSVDRGGMLVSANVSASKRELRNFVQGYGSVISATIPH